VKNKLKTGDILLFRYNNHNSRISQMVYFCRTRLVGSDYGHVALVIRDHGKLYAIEGVAIGHSAEDEGLPLNHKNAGGVRIIELDTLVQRYHSDYGGLFAVRHIKVPLKKKNIMNKLLSYRDRTFESKQYLGGLLIADFFSYDLANVVADPKRSDKIFCSEFVYRLLRDCDLIGEYNPKLFWPALFTKPIFDHLTRYRWDKVVKFTI
jgi:hypothetical protein